VVSEQQRLPQRQVVSGFSTVTVVVGLVTAGLWQEYRTLTQASAARATIKNRADFISTTPLDW